MPYMSHNKRMTENKMDENILHGIENDIEEILYSYIKAQSFTNTDKEKEAERFFLSCFSDEPYFKNTSGSYGTYAIENDALKRTVCYAFLKGTGKDTAVFIHHSDVVGVEDFKLLKDLAFSPDDLRKELLKIKDTLSEDARKDLSDDTFLFGRGVCDMKGGGAIQIALTKMYSRVESFHGNIVLLAVPDEENLSAGMRSAVKLLSEMKQKHDLDYRIMINSEPHQRKDFTQGIFSEGSVGKVMPFVYVRGFLAHAGKAFEGLNPLNVMSCIVRKTELNMDLSDVAVGEAAPPPTWLYLKDSKNTYDVSMPLAAKGCFSILTLNQTPQSILKKLKEICTESFEEVISHMNESYERFTVATNVQCRKLPWKSKVVNFSELCQEAEASYGSLFKDRYHERVNQLEHEYRKNEISVIDCNFELVDFVYGYIDDLSPRVVYGLIPPYYPNVSNLYFEILDEKVRSLSDQLSSYTLKEFNQEYTSEYFYTGISDLSYTSIQNSSQVLESLKCSMPLFGSFYDIPADSIEEISMPCINIGPWGKDFHKLTERVNKEDLYVRTPKIIHRAISIILDN